MRPFWSIGNICLLYINALWLFNGDPVARGWAACKNKKNISVSHFKLIVGVFYGRDCKSKLTYR